MRVLSRFVLLLSGVCFSYAVNIQAKSTSNPQDTAFIELYEAEWQWRLKQYPLFASSVGEHRYDHLLGQVDLNSQRKRLQWLQEFRRKVSAIAVESLSTDRQIDYAIYLEQINNSIASLEHESYLMPMTSDSSFYADLIQLPNSSPNQTKQDYDNYLSRLAAIPDYFAAHTELLKIGLARGKSLPKIVLKGREQAIREIAEQTQIEQNPFYLPFKNMPKEMDQAVAKKLRERATLIINKKVKPAYAKLFKFFTEHYQVKARDSIGASDLPDGAAYYQQTIREFTTINQTPEEIHAIGLAEVTRIRREMEAVMQETNFTSDFSAFLHFLRTDPQFYAKSPRELLMHASYYAKRIDGLLPKYFSQLPRLPYGVEKVPDAIAPYYTSGRYNPAPEGGEGAGFYWVNTYKLSSRPLYALPALTLHEAVPGHHLQGALANEQNTQPPFRRYSYISAFGEGWALYSEQLGVEMGVYETPYEHFGRLTYEMWRAARLVVDTGIHAKGWSRDQALNLLRNNTALSEHEITTEVDRYISWPGQALSYKIGELKIRELRQHAETKLKDKFDLRKFHHAVLSLGSVPLPILENQIEKFIAQELKQK